MQEREPVSRHLLGEDTEIGLLRNLLILVDRHARSLQEGWWRIFRKAALAGRSFANRNDIEYATTLATDQLSSRARPWIWGRPTPPTRPLRRRYVYTV
ncbi:hypothetical protein [Streptomyces mirabilis]|uniref:hypothetical protein n=1 Tax=Streptomyces mirabilis TaxID=68239 RepID=UPI003699207F